jgi:fluoride exporter
MSWLLVAIGSALGGVSRHACAEFVARFSPQFPWATLFVNVSGSLAIGVLGALLMAPERANSSQWARELMMVGFLGGFTTFSAFSLQTLQLLRDGRSLLAAWNVMGSVMLCLTATWIGFAIGTRLHSH